MSEKIDPFFEPIQGSTWNACVGRQGDEESYIDGYIQASLLLTSSILKYEMYASRDTLVLPIMYNARHAIELVLKYVTTELSKTKPIQGPKKTHNINNLLEKLEKIVIPDKVVRDNLSFLRPFVSSLSQIDKDGQSFRFRHGIDDSTNLTNLSTINYRLLLNSLEKLQKIVKTLRIQIVRFSEESKLGTHTNKLSRNDLITIAKMLPKYELWKSTEFAEAKEKICAEYGLSKTQFLKAIDLITSRRLFSKLTGNERKLIYLTEEKAKYMLDLWKEQNGPTSCSKTSPPEAKIILNTSNDFLQLLQDELSKPPSNILSLIKTNFSIKEFAEAQVLYYLARNNEYVELYEDEIEQTINHLNKDEMFSVQIYHIMNKTNFEEYFIKGLEQVGSLSLAAALSDCDTLYT